MSRLSDSSTKSAAAKKRADRAGFQFRIGHVLAAALLLGLLAWGGLVLMIKLVIAALR